MVLLYNFFIIRAYSKNMERKVKSGSVIKHNEQPPLQYSVGISIYHITHSNSLSIFDKFWGVTVTKNLVLY